MSSIVPSRKIVAIAAAIASLAAIVAYQCFGIEYNTTPSMPMGYYFVNRLDRTPRRGQIVVLQPNAVAAAYVLRYHDEAGVDFVKIAAAVSGDTIAFTARGARVDGRLIPHSAAISKLGNRALPSLAFGRYHIARGEAWGWTPVWDSFDSRYYGPLVVEGIAVPIFTWDAPPQPRPTHLAYR